MNNHETYLNINDKKAYVKILEVSKEVPNIIFIMTPIVTVEDPLALAFMKGLISKNCNVFALDFLGIGNSEGSASNITYRNMKLAILELIKYIRNNYSQSIHFYGGTGTGGVIGQALCSDKAIGKYIHSYSQFGVGNFGDLSPAGNTILLKACFPIIKLLGEKFPGKRLKFKVPNYTGYNAKRENEWYKKTMRQYPGAFDIQLSLLSLILGLHLNKDSPMRKTPDCPVLILASKHDRYFKEKYIEKYYESICGEKNIVWYADSHLAFYWRAEEMNGEVLEWIAEKSK